MRSARLLVGLAMVALFAMTPGQVIAAPGDWPTYHRSNGRDGNDASASPFSGIVQQWTTSALDGQIYASPLVVGNQVIVVTENNSIYSLDALTGSVTWGPTNFGPPMRLSDPGYGNFGCGNIDPMGITGTPVVDTATGVVYAAVFTGGTYKLAAVNLSDGTQKFAPIAMAPSGFNPFRQQQRGALILANGYVYVPFGGYIGDCPTYHGYVIGVKADGSTATLRTFNAQAQAVCPVSSPNRAGIWAASGESADAAGNLYVATGNGNPTGTYNCGETVFKLSPALGYVDSWAPAAWSSLDASDADVGSIAPILVGPSGNLVFQTGKNGWGYLLSAGALSSNSNHIGGEAFNGPVCDAAVSSNSQTAQNDQVFGGLAYADPYIYVPCPQGIKALTLSGASFSRAWSTPGFRMGAPILSGGVLWAIDTGSNLLRGFDPSSGVLKFTASLGAQQHFPTPAAGQGRIYVADGAGPNVIRAFGQGAGRYHPLTPTRIYDSRNGAGPLGPQTARNIQVTGQPGVPSTGVAAAIVNVTVDRTSTSSFLTVFPAGFQRPNTSNLNWVGGKTIANLVEVAVGNLGQVTVYNQAGFTDVILDIQGYIATPGVSGPDGLFTPVVPARILDTRDGTGAAAAPIGQGASIDVQVTGRGNVDPTATAVVFNLTATNPTMQSFLTVYPKDAARPNASNVNFSPNTSVPNRVVVKLGTGGKITIYNPAGSVDAIADVNGWFTGASAGVGVPFSGVAPTRILDTRDGTGGISGPFAPGQVSGLQVAGVGGVPSMAASTPPKAVVLNVTVTRPTSPTSILTVWPATATQPGTSDLNFVTGQTVANLVIVQVGSNGKVNIYNALGSVDVVADIMGWYG